jgi:hypothetical protein
MKYAWIENNRIRDICQGGNPNECYTPNVAINYSTLVPDEARNGWDYVNGVASEPIVPEEPEVLLEPVNGTEPDVIE